MQDIQALLPADENSILALDLETQGTDYSHPDSRIVGIGLADKHGCFYLDWDGLSDPAREWLYDTLRRRPLTSFNVQFDGGFLWNIAGLGWLNWSMDTFGLFRQLATEGHSGQNWKLDTFIQDVLGWPESNKSALDEALARHHLTKADMYKLSDLEWETFAKYCALDAEAHLQAFEYLAEIVREMQGTGRILKHYHTHDYLNEVELLIEQQLRGLRIDVPQLRRYKQTLARDIEQGLRDFFQDPEVKEGVADYNAQIVAAEIAKEPPTHNPSGSRSKRWDNWRKKIEHMKTCNYFNPGSPQQLGWLFYDRLGYSVRKYTATGGRSVDKEVLPFLGSPGRLLSRVRKKQKELGYVEACLSKQRDEVLHPQCKSVGTLTGRLAGGFENE